MPVPDHPSTPVSDGVPGLDKLLDAAQVVSDWSFKKAWGYMAYRHRRDEILFIGLEHTHAFIEEVVMLLRPDSTPPSPGRRESTFRDQVFDDLDIGARPLAQVQPLHRDPEEIPG